MFLFIFVNLKKKHLSTSFSQSINIDPYHIN